MSQDLLFSYRWFIVVIGDILFPEKKSTYTKQNS